LKIIRRDSWEFDGTYIKNQKSKLLVDRIKRLSNEVLNEYSERFGTDFSSNKQTLNEITIIRSKGLKNEIAGYITKMLQRQAKFEERKQMIIENEKKSQEYKKSRSKKPETESTEEAEVQVESTEEAEVQVESTEEAEVQVESKPEPIITDEKTIAEEIIDESKSE